MSAIIAPGGGVARAPMERETSCNSVAGILTLAVRNLRRNMRRSLYTMLAIMVGSLAAFLFGGYAKCIEFGLETNIVRSDGHLQVQHPDYLLFGAGAGHGYSVERPEKIVAGLLADPYVAEHAAVISPTLSFNGVAGNFDEGLSQSALVVGAVPADQAKMRQWNGHDMPIAPGPARLVGTSDAGAVIGDGAAQILQLCEAVSLPKCPRPTPLSDHNDAVATPSDLQLLAQTTEHARPAHALLQLLASTPNGVPNVAQLDLKGAERQGVRELDNHYVGIHLAQAQRLIFGAHTAPRATSVVLQLHATADMPMVKRRVEDLLARQYPQQPLVVNDFKAIVPTFVQTMDLVNTIFGFIGMLIMLIVMFTVGNTMSMAVVERTVEIGTLRAIGLRRSGIRRMFVLEGAILGAVGALLGLVIAILVAQGIQVLGLTWVPPGYVTPMPLAIQVLGQWQLIAGVTATVIGVAVLSSYVPARRASNLVVVDALRHV